MNKNNYRNCVGGILLLAAGIFSILAQIFAFYITSISFGGSLPAELSATYAQNLIRETVYALPLIVLGVTLLMKKSGIITIILSGILMVLNLITLINNLIVLSSMSADMAIYVNWIGTVFSVLTYASLLVLSIGTLNPQPNALKKLWFLPGICYAIYTIAVVIYVTKTAVPANNLYWDPAAKIATIVGALPIPAMHTAGFFLSGHWLANPYKKGYQPQQVQPQYQQPQYQQPQYQQYQYQQYQYQQYQYQQYQQPAQPQYDEQTMQALNYYKWQYESGAITWEQYNAAIQPYLAQYNK